MAEAEAYAREAGIDVDARQFVEANNAAGWIAGDGRPVKNWRLWMQGYAVRNKAQRSRLDDPTRPDPRIEAFEALKRKYQREEAMQRDQDRDGGDAANHRGAVPDE